VALSVLSPPPPLPPPPPPYSLSNHGVRDCSRQRFESKGLIVKVFRNKDLARLSSLWSGLFTPKVLSGVTIFFISRSFRIIYLAGNSFQIFEFKGVIRKIFRNKELAWQFSSLDFGRGLTADCLNFVLSKSAD
jgi:hypothetical protein